MSHLINTFHYPIWPVNHVQAVSTTRLPPQPVVEHRQASLYDFFNLGLHVNDEPQHVLANRQVLKQQFPETAKMQWLDQVHGNQVAVVEQCSDTPIIADASITRVKNIVLSVMTADCLPILLAHANGTEVAAIHGGWRSLANNIITETLKKMDSQPDELVAWLGPCISQEVFEIGSEVKQVFVEQHTVFEQAFTRLSSNKYLADLQQIARIQLQRLGVNNIYKLENCTYQQQREYYSFRRDGQTGRMATAICRL